MASTTGVAEVQGPDDVATAGTWVDVHHIVPRALGGRHVLENLICLCGAHHRAVHRRTLVIEGSPATELRFLHSDGRRYGDMGVTRRFDAHLQVLGALKNLGFRESDGRLALDRCSSAIEAGAPVGEILQAALALLTERAVQTE